MKNSKTSFLNFFASGWKKSLVKFQVPRWKVKGGVCNWSWKTKVARKSPSKFQYCYLHVLDVLTKTPVTQKLKRITKFCKLHLKGEEICQKISSTCIFRQKILLGPQKFFMNLEVAYLKQYWNWQNFATRFWLWRWQNLNNIMIQVCSQAKLLVLATANLLSTCYRDSKFDNTSSTLVRFCYAK